MLFTTNELTLRGSKRAEHECMEGTEGAVYVAQQRSSITVEGPMG
jgi:hypothetical protein